MQNKLLRRKIILLLVIWTFVIVSVTGATGSGSVSDLNKTPVQPTIIPSGAYVPGEVIVKYKNQTSGFAAESISSPKLMALGAGLSDEFSAEGLKDMQMMHFDENASVQQAIAELKNSSYVEYAEPNYIFSLSPNENVTPPGPIKTGVESVSGGPNDPRFNEQWALSNTGQNSGTPGADINIIPAWTKSTGSDSIVIAEIDTGVDYTHPDLSPNIWTNSKETAGNGIDDDGNGYVDDIRGWNFVDNTNNPMDDNGHGTHCAGIIGAVGNNGIGISGVNQKVKIMPLKVLGKDGTGTMADILKAFAYAKMMGANVISCSWGGTTRSQALADAIAQTNIPIVCAAGNSGVNTDIIPQYPSGFDSSQIISVAASDASDKMPSFSNYGPTSVDVAAPGDSILSTYPTALGYQYVVMSGTSMATPHVTGLVALLLSINPALTPVQVKQLIMNNVNSLPDFTGKVASGGRINAGKTLAAASGASVIPLPGMTSTPRDLNGDGKYEDVNGNGRVDFADVVLFFNNMDWVAAHEPVSAFDFSGNGRIDFTDIVTLFKSMS